MAEQDDIQGGRAHCVWVLAASPFWTPTDLGHLPASDALIAADGGSSLAAQLGLTPDLVIGDLDSSDPALIETLQRSGTRLDLYRHEAKWETDTELGVLAALEMGAETIILLGAAGARLDHTLANVLLLTHPRLASVDVRLVDGRQTLLLAKPGKWNALPAQVGDTVSLLPVGGQANGVRTEGLEYQLDREALLPGRGRGVSNVVTQERPGVYLESGTLLIVIVQKGRTKEY